MKKTTDELLELLKRESDLEHYIDTVSDDLIKQIPLSDYLNTLIEEKGFKKAMSFIVPDWTAATPIRFSMDKRNQIVTR